MAVAALAATAAAMLALLPAAAATADTPVLVSADGTHFGSTLPKGLFPSMILVPATSRTATLYVRNPTSRPVTLTLRVSDVTYSDPSLANALTVTAKAGPPATVTAVHLDAIATCEPLLAGAPVAPNGTIAVPVTVAMADVDGAIAQAQHADLTIHVVLQDAVAPAPADPCAPGTPVPAFSGSTASLARTGSDVTLPLAAAACSLGVGIAIVVAARRRRRDT
jgi:hypothetical protein